MEKLNFKFLTTIGVLAMSVIATPVFAGPGFRLSSKAPVHHLPQQQHRAYVFGYGGVDTGAHWDTTAGFDETYGDPSLAAFPINFDLKNGTTFGGGAGVYSGLLGGMRFEIEGSNTRNEIGTYIYNGFELPTDIDIETSAVMFNILKEVPLGSFIGYFGGGLGHATTTFEGDVDTIEYDDRDSGFAYQFIAGVDIPIGESLSFFTQYRYLVLSDLGYTTDFGDFNFSTDDNPSSHAVLFGARVSF